MSYNEMAIMVQLRRDNRVMVGSPKHTVTIDYDANNKKYCVEGNSFGSVHVSKEHYAVGMVMDFFKGKKDVITKVI